MSDGQATCACGCGEGLNSGRRFVHGHNRRVDPVMRFWRQVDKTESCWQWTGWVSNRGYGQLLVAQKHVLVHRFAYETLVGPIPDGLTIDHLCFNKACVNPAHLEPVTMQENSRRAYARITHCPQGHEYTPENRLTRHGKQRRECRQCNREAALRRYHTRKAVTR